MKIKYKNLFLPLLLVIILTPLRADAYLDPGSGSVIFQVVIAFFAGIAFFIKTYWHKLKFFFTKNKSINNNKSSDDVDE